MADAGPHPSLSHAASSPAAPMSASASGGRPRAISSLERAASTLPPLPYNPAYPASSVDRPIEELLRVAGQARRKAEAVRDTLGAGAMKAASAAATTLDPLKKVALKQLDPLKQLTEAEIKKAEQKFRQRFGGLDDSLSSAVERRKQLAGYHAVFEMLDVRGKGAIPINDVEDLFGAAELYEARTEVGTLSYDADRDGNGSLDFDEFVVVMDKLMEYHARTGSNAPDARGSFLFGVEGAALSLKQITWRTLDDPSFSAFSRIVGFILLSAVAMAIGIFVLQTVPSVDSEWHHVFVSLEAWCLTVFTGEYLLRFLTCPDRRAFLFSVSNTIDLLTIIPYYIEAIYDTNAAAAAAIAAGGSAGGNTIRVIRIFRVFRIVKVLKYVPYVSIMTQSASASAAPICMAVFVMLIGMILLAFAAYFTERGTWDDARDIYIQPDGSPSPFQSISEASYWAIVTLTTVGYGDLTPVTNVGQVVGALTALAGTIIVAFPVSIYTEEFSKEYNSMVKTRALQAELGGQDLCERLLGARKRHFHTIGLAHYPVGTSLTDALSSAVPRNLTMMRHARQMKVQRAAGLVGEGGGELSFAGRISASRGAPAAGAGASAAAAAGVGGGAGRAEDGVASPVSHGGHHHHRHHHHRHNHGGGGGRTHVGGRPDNPAEFHTIWARLLADSLNVREEDRSAWTLGEYAEPYRAVPDADPLLPPGPEPGDTSAPVEQRVQAAWFTRLRDKLRVGGGGGGRGGAARGEAEGAAELCPPSRGPTGPEGECCGGPQRAHEPSPAGLVGGRRGRPGPAGSRAGRRARRRSACGRRRGGVGSPGALGRTPRRRARGPRRQDPHAIQDGGRGQADRAVLHAARPHRRLAGGAGDPLPPLGQAQARLGAGEGPRVPVPRRHHDRDRPPLAVVDVHAPRVRPRRRRALHLPQARHAPRPRVPPLGAPRRHRVDRFGGGCGRCGCGRGCGCGWWRGQGRGGHRDAAGEGRRDPGGGRRRGHGSVSRRVVRRPRRPRRRQPHRADPRPLHRAVRGHRAGGVRGGGPARQGGVARRRRQGQGRR
jgi:voltage-gated potassium channel